MNMSYFRILRKLVKKHSEFPVIYTTMGVWPTDFLLLNREIVSRNSRRIAKNIIAKAEKKLGTSIIAKRKEFKKCRNRKIYHFFFVILNYMNYSLTAHLVDNIKKSIVGYDEYGILIVDNASPNESYEILKKQFDGVEDVFGIKNNMNQGYAKGNNFGVKYIEKNFSECKYVAITNPDVEFFDNTDLGKILEKLESNTMIASIAPIHLLNGVFNQKAIGWKHQEVLMIFLQVLH